MNGTVDGTTAPPPKRTQPAKVSHVTSPPTRGCPHANTQALHWLLPHPIQRTHCPLLSNAQVNLVVDVARPHVRQSRQARHRQHARLDWEEGRQAGKNGRRKEGKEKRRKEIDGKDSDRGRE